MGSPFRHTVANCYMYQAKNEVLQCFTKPHLYARYVDDIFLEVNHEVQLHELKNQFENRTVLKFMCPRK